MGECIRTYLEREVVDDWRLADIMSCQGKERKVEFDVANLSEMMNSDWSP
jgi:hypothetical protein